MTADEAANKTLVLKVLTELFEDRDGSAIDRYHTGRLIQHNPLFPDGTDELRERVTASARTCATRPAWSPPTGTS